MAAEIRVFVFDYLPVYSHGLTQLLNGAEGISARASTSETQIVIDELVNSHSNVLILGLAGNPDEIAVSVEQVRASIPNIQVLVLVDPDDGARIGDLMRLGSINLLSRRARLDEVVETVRAAAAGRSIVAADIAPRMLDELSEAVRRAESRWLPGGLTRRELEVLSYVADGLPNRDVAKVLHISENTVKNHMRSIHEKMGVKTRTEAVVKAAKDGLLGSRLAKLTAMRPKSTMSGSPNNSVNTLSE